MSISLFLATIASVLAGHHVSVYCNHPPGTPWTGSVYGYAVWMMGTTRYDKIYLRNCRATRLGKRQSVDIFAHEILHIKHKSWPHWRIYAVEHSYGAVVLREIHKRS